MSVQCDYSPHVARQLKLIVIKEETKQQPSRWDLTYLSRSLRLCLQQMAIGPELGAYENGEAGDVNSEKNTRVCSHDVPLMCVALDGVVCSKICGALDVVATKEFHHLDRHYGVSESEQVDGSKQPTIAYWSASNA